MDENEKAYIAGLFDGEGSVSFFFARSSKNGKRYGRLTAKISNTHKETLEWVKKTVGYGRVHVSAKPPGRPIQYAFCVVQEQARRFLNTIKPFLRIKSCVMAEKLKEDAIHCRRRNQAPVV